MLNKITWQQELTNLHNEMSINMDTDKLSEAILLILVIKQVMDQNNLNERCGKCENCNEINVRIYYVKNNKQEPLICHNCPSSYDENVLVLSKD